MSFIGQLVVLTKLFLGILICYSERISSTSRCYYLANANLHLLKQHTKSWQYLPDSSKSYMVGETFKDNSHFFKWRQATNNVVEITPFSFAKSVVL